MRGFAALLALAAVAAPTVPAGAQQTAQRQVKLDVSPAGQAIMKKYLGARDPGIDGLLKQLQGVVGQLRQLPRAQKLDLARMQGLMRQQETLQSQISRRNNDRTLAMLREMSEVDRLKFLRGLEAAGQAQAAARKK